MPDPLHLGTATTTILAANAHYKNSKPFNHKNLPFHSSEWRARNVKKKLDKLGRLNPLDPYYEEKLPGITNMKALLQNDLLI